MLKVIYRISLALMLLCTCTPHSVEAQSAKTIFAQVSGTVFDLNGKPVASAVVHLDGPVHVQNTADSGGHFVFANVSPGTYTISASATGFETLTRSNVVVQNEDVNLDIRLSLVGNLKEIGHVSTTSGRGAINITAAPSYNLTPDDMAFQGTTGWRQILDEIPGVSVTGGAANLQGAIVGSPNQDQVISIRGALPYETSMLIDNMPMYGANPTLSAGGGVDLSPYSAQNFNAFDVVSGPGAQSPSIVDTIGGSLNLHPAGQLTRDRYNFSVAEDPYGGWIANGLVGLRLGKLSVTVTYGLNNSPGPLHNGGQQQLAGATFGEHIGAVDGNTFACTGLCGQYPFSFPGGNGTPFSGASTFEISGGQSSLIGCCFTVPNGWMQHNGSLSLFYQLSPAVIGQFYAAINNHTGGYPNFILPTVFTPPAGYAGSLPSGAMISPVLQSCQYGAFTGASQIYEGKFTFQLGRGQLQLAALSNTSEAAYATSIPTTATLQLFGDGAYCTNPSCSSTTPVIYNGSTNTVTLLPYTYSSATYVHNRDLSANYAVPLGDRARATASYVHSYYNNPISANLFFQYNFAGTICNIAYNTLPQSNYEETNEFHFGYGFNPTERISVDLSYYVTSGYFHVLDPANTANTTYLNSPFHYGAPRASFVWRPNSNWAFRASTGGGFAIAPLNDFLSTNAGPFCFAGICEQFLPNVNLQPETSWGYDLGFDTRLTHSTILSFDLYQTDLRGQLYNSTTQDGMLADSPLYLIQYRNLGESRYQGIELDLRHDVPAGVIWSISGSLMRGYLVNVPPGFYNCATGVDCANPTVVPNLNFNGTFTSAQIPYAQGFGMYGYRWSENKFIEVDAHYLGNNNGYYWPAFVAFDANAQMSLTKNVALQGTLNNITGIHDAKIESYGQGSIFPTAFGASAYTPAVPYGPRTFLLTLRVHSL